MNDQLYSNALARFLSEVGVAVSGVEDRSFPGEHWLIAFVSDDSLPIAQSLAGTFEARLKAEFPSESSSLVVVFRPSPSDDVILPSAERKGRLFQNDVDQLIQLLEARSRTSDALPSLKYMEDPRASLSAVGASRHQLVFGRRGVGKTALLIEGKRVAERDGHVAVWLNAHVLRGLSADRATAVIANHILEAVARAGGNSEAPSFQSLRQVRDNLKASSSNAGLSFFLDVASINSALRGVLRADLLKLYVYIDDFYLLESSLQPIVLDTVAGMLRDANGWLKVASIERLTRVYEPSTRTGLEFPHDATRIDLDVTLEDPQSTQQFLEEVLINYTLAAGIRSPGALAKPEALGRLVLASGGVPRDYLNLFASSLLVARQARPLAKEVGREDVAKAVQRSAQDKKRDLEQDVNDSHSDAVLSALTLLSVFVKGKGYAFFRIDVQQKQDAGYELLALLVDLRFVHLVQASLSDQHRSGVRYEAYVLALSECSDVRLRRGLRVLDLESGKWTYRLTGTAKSRQNLDGTRLRDQLRQGPLVDTKILLGAPEIS